MCVREEKKQYSNIAKKVNAYHAQLLYDCQEPHEKSQNPTSEYQQKNKQTSHSNNIKNTLTDELLGSLWHDDVSLAHVIVVGGHVAAQAPGHLVDELLRGQTRGASHVARALAVSAAKAGVKKGKKKGKDERRGQHSKSTICKRKRLQIDSECAN